MKAPRAPGFTLVEVLVALVIVALGMSAVLATITSAADTTSYLRERAFAEWVAMNRIAELRLQPQRPALGKSDGETEFAGRRWRWEQEVLKLEVPGTRRIDVRVRPADAPKGTSVTVVGMVGDALLPPDGLVILPGREAGGSGAPGPAPSQPTRDGATPPPAPEPGSEPTLPQPQPQPPAQ